MIEPERIILIGMMGAGKSTVGGRLSELTGWPYIDNDEVVEQMVGMPTRDLLRVKGVAAMRAAESAAAQEVVSRPPPLIAGAAAGIETLASRIEGTYRPWLGDDPEATLRSLYAGREPLYEEIADCVIDVDHTTPD